MKIKLIYLLFLSFFLSSNSTAQFWKPNDNQVFDLGYGQSTVNNIEVEWNIPDCDNPKFRLTTHEGSYTSWEYYGIDHDYDLGPGEYTFRIEAWCFIYGQGEVPMYDETITFYVQPAIKVENEFSAGSIKVDNLSKSSGYSFNPDWGESTSLEAVDQYYNPYERYFKEWAIPGGTSSSRTISAPAPTTEHTLYTAKFNSEYNITFQNSLPGNGNSGVIKVNSTQYNSPSTGHTVVQPNTITGTAVNQTIDGIYYTFTQWSDASTYYNKTFSPNDHGTYTASFSSKPVWSNRNLHTNYTPEAYVIVYWNEHPNSDVNYKLYRKIKTNGVMGSEVLRATVNHGTTHWTDNVQIADGSTNQLLYYDVRAYHTTTSTYSDDDFEATVYMFTQENIQTTDENQYQTAAANENALADEEVIPTETTLGNFPNPFNPSTVISYQLTVDSKVVLKVYDMLGKEVATLVNDTKPAGSYNVSFNGANLPSGVYIYTLQTNNQAMSRKMLLMK